MQRMARTLLLIAALSPAAAQAENLCGSSFSDWCTAPKDGACGRHLNETDCRADKACIGMKYEGESMVACNWDERGFATNCPAVGCLDK